jgi:hypothetical protein
MPPERKIRRVAFFAFMQGRSGAKRCFDGQWLKFSSGPVMHEDHDGFQPLFEPGTDGFIESQPPFSEVKGRDDAAHGKGVGVGKDRILGECRFGFDEDLLRRLVAVLETTVATARTRPSFFSFEGWKVSFQMSMRFSFFAIPIGGQLDDPAGDVQAGGRLHTLEPR